MANLCSFEAKIIGKKSNIKKLLNALEQKNHTWIGRGAFDLYVSSEEKLSNGEYATIIIGCCKWSMLGAWVENAESMKKQANGEASDWEWSDLEKGATYYTIFEAVEAFDLDFEAWSEEEGCEFQEHILTTRNNRNTDIECVDWGCYYLDTYETKKEAEEDLDITLTDEEWNEGWGPEGEGTLNWGGFPNAYQFEI